MPRPCNKACCNPMWFVSDEFQDRVKIRDLQIGTLVQVSLRYNEFQRMWEANTLKIETHAPKCFETSPTNPPPCQPQQPEVVPEKPAIHNGIARQTQTGVINQPSPPEEPAKRRVEQWKFGPTQECRTQRWNDHWKPPPPSGRRQNEKGNFITSIMQVANELLAYAESQISAASCWNTNFIFRSFSRVSQFVNDFVAP